jgi:hypothetical protein
VCLGLFGAWSFPAACVHGTHVQHGGRARLTPCLQFVKLPADVRAHTPALR